MMKTKIIQWLFAAVMTAWLGVIIILILGDENPNNPMPLIDFFLLKAFGLAMGVVFHKVLVILERENCLPPFMTTDPDDESDE